MSRARLLTEARAPDEAAAFFLRHPAIDYVDAIVTDMTGIVRGKRLRRADAVILSTDGLMLPGSVMLLDVTGRDTDSLGHGFSDGDPDKVARPIPGSFAPVPWLEQPTAQVLMTLFEPDGRPYAFDPRQVLARVVERFAELELTPVVAFEIEFYLIDPRRDEAGRVRPLVWPNSERRPNQTQVYSMAEIEVMSGFLDDIVKAAAVQDIPLGPMTSEYGPGQMEINLRHQADALKAADHCVLFKRLVKSVARRHGIAATFMAKPYAERAGSGMHIHMSLLDGRGQNVFADESPTGAPPLLHVIAGLLAIAPNAMAIYAPNVNSYRRMDPNRFAPINLSWAVNNRSVSLRIPAGPAEARRIEHRFAGADANPYLVLAAMLAGVHHGLKLKDHPGPAATGNAALQKEDLLPRSWRVALNTMAGSKVLGDYLGHEYLQAFGAAKRFERAAFQAPITPLEYEWYLLTD